MQYNTTSGKCDKERIRGINMKVQDNGLGFFKVTDLSPANKLYYSKILCLNVILKQARKHRHSNSQSII